MATAILDDTIFLGSMPRRNPSERRYTASLTSDPKELEAQEHWKAVSRRLLNWRRSPSRVDEDGWESPSDNAIRAADELAELLSNVSFYTAFETVADGEGGILFERKNADSTELFSINVDGMIEYIELKESRVIARYRV